MGATYLIEYHPAVMAHDVPHLGRVERQEIIDAIHKKLVVAPEVFGKPLRQTLRGYRTFRVKDFRVIFRIQGKILKVLRVGHRSTVYPEAIRRLGL